MKKGLRWLRDESPAVRSGQWTAMISEECVKVGSSAPVTSEGKLVTDFG